MYQITGDVSYLRKVRGAWDDVARRQLYITGGVSVAEHYEPGFRRPVTGDVVETCANMSWMELTQRLLELTADPRYADTVERLLLNHVFAAQTVDGDCYRYHTPPNGFKPGDYFHGPDCCTGSGHRIVAMLPRFIYGQGKAAVYVNQFVPSTAHFKFGRSAVTLKQETRYPQTDDVLLRVELEGNVEFTLNVRSPAWCEKPSVELNGNLLPDVRPGTYARIQRTWRRGDTVRVTFPMKARWIEHDHYEGGSAPWALVRGPVVYALDTVWWNDTTVPAPYDAGQEAGWLRDEAKFHELPTSTGALGPFYETEVMLLSGEKAKATLVPFSNIGRWYRDGAPKPERGSRAFSYAVWLRDSVCPEFATAAAEQRQMRERVKDSIDFVHIGDSKSEHDHNVKGTGNTGNFNGRSYRHAGAGGWLSYELKVPTDKSSVLVVTYWGGETGERTFDVLVNDRKLATQKLDMDKPGKFFEVGYPVPLDLVQGKTDTLGQKVNKLTVKFQAHPGNTAGGVFGVRIMGAN